MFDEYHEAIECYTIAISYNQDYAEAYYNRALAYLMSYRPVQGCNDFNEAVHLQYEKADDMRRIYCGN